MAGAADDVDGIGSKLSANDLATLDGVPASGDLAPSGDFFAELGGVFFTKNGWVIFGGVDSFEADGFVALAGDSAFGPSMSFRFIFVIDAISLVSSFKMLAIFGPLAFP